MVEKGVGMREPFESAIAITSGREWRRCMDGCEDLEHSVEDQAKYSSSSKHLQGSYDFSRCNLGDQNTDLMTSP